VRIGVIGLGNMGSALARNLVERGHDLVVHDVAGPSRCPDGATFGDDTSAVAAHGDVVVFSLPDGSVSEQVARALVAAPDRRVKHVVDTSTVGPTAAAAVEQVLAAADIGYVDAPVSGGAGGARARTLVIMYAGSDPASAAVQPVLADLSDRLYRVGDRPGMAQVLKLANNFLSATALAATSEAVAFAVSAGLDMTTVLEVINASSGQSAASSDKFVHHVLPGRYASGFLNTLMSKDLDLYLRSAQDADVPTGIGQASAALWRQFAEAEPATDFTRIYPFVRTR
jgi:3-hydroxyisobutyrate dehydrogenase-like beta-hydroxyacid dehydrogenase